MFFFYDWRKTGSGIEIVTLILIVILWMRMCNAADNTAGLGVALAAATIAILVAPFIDLLVFKGANLMGKTLAERKSILETKLAPKLREPLRYMSPVEGKLEQPIKAVKELGLEGLVAKRLKSEYEPGRRSGAWQKMRVNMGQEFVIGGYTFGALVFGYYERGKLLYASRTRNGFTPLSRTGLLKKLKPRIVKECPFANLPEARAGRSGAGLTAAKMKDCVWLKPVQVGQFEFVEWTDDGHLRHSKVRGAAGG